MKDDPLAARSVVPATIALFALGIARPLLDLLGRNAEIFVAHSTSSFDVVALAVGLTLLVPLAAAAVVLLASAVHRTLGGVLLALGITAMVAAFVVSTVRIADPDGATPGWLAIAIALAAGAAFAVVYRRSGNVRGVLRVAALVAPVVALMFLFMTPAHRVVFPASAQAQTVDVPAGAPPIVLVIFDEFPVASLLDADGDVDAKAFPALARLAADGTFFNNTTTVHARTMDAVPAIVSGVRSQPDSLPTAADHPTSLFALLQDDYRMHVVEPLTALCPPEACHRGDETGLARWRVLLRDIGIVQAHLLVPADWAGILPPLNEGWRDFAKAAGKGGPQTRDDFLEQGRTKRARWPAEYRRFVRGITASSEPTVHFMHVGGLPHYPWVHLPDGRQYQTAPVEGSGLAGVAGINKYQRWSDREWPVAQGYQRHLVQVQFVDHLVGQLMDQLEREGMYDESLIVITADHGASFRPDAPLRKLTSDNIGEVGAVPLFVKLPRDGGAATSAVPAETVDIVPTILDVLGAKAPGGLDGLSVFGDAVTERTDKRISEVEFGTDITFRADHGQTQKAAARKLALFGGRDHLDPFRLVPTGYDGLLGAPVQDIARQATRVDTDIDDAAAYESVDLDAQIVPALLEGTVADTRLTDAPVLAIGLNGTVAAVTQADPPGANGAYAFRALLPPEALRNGGNEVEVYVLHGGR